MSLPFLRPMGLPRPSTLSRFLGVARVSTTTTTTTASSFTAPPISTPAKPYRVGRTGTDNLPVYTLSKRGGNMKLTTLKHIEGNVNVLRADLQQALAVDETEVKINPITKHIIIKGHKKKEVMKFLEDNRL